MGMFEGPSAKRHQIWSSDEAVVQSLIDKAGTMEPGKTFAKTLCSSYVDKNGIRRHTGKRKELKESQYPVCELPFPGFKSVGFLWVARDYT